MKNEQIHKKDGDVRFPKAGSRLKGVHLYAGVIMITLAAVLLLSVLIIPTIVGDPSDLVTSPNATVADSPDLSSAPSPQATLFPASFYNRTYDWTYGDYRNSYTVSIPIQLYAFYRSQPHDRNYAKYAISDKDRKILNAIIAKLEGNGTKTEAAYDVIAFVQSLPYFRDDISTGYDEYPRYPIETLVDGGGDCEDTAILTAALLKEMHYDVVLLRLPKHMAVGVTCTNCEGTYYLHDNKKYFYLETTGNNWKVGQIPPNLKDERVIIYSI